MLSASIATSLSAWAGDPYGVHERDGSFDVTPFTPVPVDTKTMGENIHALLRNSDKCATDAANCVVEADAVAIQNEALQFRKSLQDAVAAKLEDPSGGKIAYHDIWYKDGLLDLPLREHHHVTFPSLIQRPGGHPADRVVIDYIAPIFNGKCPSKMKTTIVISGATEDNEPEISQLATGVSNIEDVATVFVHMPQYGPRRQLPNGKLDPKLSHTRYDPAEFNSDFLNVRDKAATEENVRQAMLDIHATVDWVNSIRKCSSPGSISILGLSLGSAVGLLYEGVEPGRLTGGDAFYAPAADLSHAASSFLKAPRYQDSYFHSLLTSLNWDTDQGRKIWGEFDALTWAGQIKDRKVLLIRAKRDEIFQSKYSYDPLYAAIKDHNQIKAEAIDTGHNPSLTKGPIYEAVHMFFPIASYLEHHGMPANQPDCQTGMTAQ